MITCFTWVSRRTIIYFQGEAASKDSDERFDECHVLITDLLNAVFLVEWWLACTVALVYGGSRVRWLTCTVALVYGGSRVRWLSCTVAYVYGGFRVRWLSCTVALVYGGSCTVAHRRCVGHHIRPTVDPGAVGPPRCGYVPANSSKTRMIIVVDRPELFDF